MSLSASPRSRARWARHLWGTLGTPGLFLGLFSLWSFGFGLIVLVRESDRLRRTGRDAVRPVISGWVRTLPVDYLGSTLTDYADRWRRASASDRASALANLQDALDRLGDQFDRPELRRTQVIEVVALDLAPPGGRPLASWRPRSSRRPGPTDLTDQVTVIEDGNQGRLLELRVRYRIPVEIERAAIGLEGLYQRLSLAILGLSLFPLLCLIYMFLQAGALRERAAREAAREATLDLADRTCHELGNAAFVLSNERRNLEAFLDLIEHTLDATPALLSEAASRSGISPESFQAFRRVLQREQARLGLDPEVELRQAAELARSVCRQLAVSSEYIALTVRELDGYLKQTPIPLRLTPLDPGTCLDEALTLLGPKLESSGIRVDRPAGPFPLLIGDRRLLVHALVNLLKNATEALSESGPDGTIRLGIENQADDVQIEIADNGPGIPADSLRRCFLAGFTTKGPGRGRGLTIAAESIALQGGSIEVRSRPGEGTAFVIRLPRAPGPAEAPPKNADP